MTPLSAIQRVLDAREEQCATFIAADNPSSWLQFLAGRIVVAAYPSYQLPEPILLALGSCVLADWAPGKYVRVELSVQSATQIATWIGRYFCDVLDCESPVVLKITLADLYG